MAKRIVFSKKAYADVDRIVEFNNLRNQSDTYSKKFIKNLHSSLKTLSKHPLLGIRTNLPHQFLFIWDTFYIFYTDTETTIEITSIYHQKEDVSF
ncbi:type II toxin-antitoxin system RelE/ParE family toxin [Mucilaginibacter sp. AW1-3]